MNSFFRVAMLTVVLGPLLVTAPAFGQLTQEVAGAGTIDWGSRVIMATGIGAPPPNIPDAEKRPAALEKARQNAIQKLLETIKGVNITSETTLRNYMAENAEMVAKVEGVMKGFRQVGEPSYLTDLSVELDVEVDLSGELSDLFLPKTGGGKTTSGPIYLCPTCGQPWPPDKPLPPEAQQAVASSAPSGIQVYTGLIIDARGIGVQPAIAPKVLNEDGKEIYGVSFVDRKYAVSQGILGYGKDMAKVKADKRVGMSPLVVKALRASGTRRADLVISNSHANLIHGMSENLNFLKKCAVMVVL